MKTLFLLLLAVSIGYPAAAQSNEHPIIHKLATTADVIAIVRLREPPMWFTSELIVETGLSTALVERTLKGQKLPPRITIQVVRQWDPNPELPNSENPKGELELPVTPATPSKSIKVDDTASLEKAEKVIVFLRRSEKGALSAVDGFLYTLPYSPELEGVVTSAANNQAQQAVPSDGHKPSSHVAPAGPAAPADAH